MRRWAMVGTTALALASAFACDRQAPEADVAIPRVVQKVVPIRKPPQTLGFHIVDLQIEQHVGADQAVPGVDNARLDREFRPTIAKLPQVRGVGPLPKGALPTDQVGVDIAVSWQVVDLEGTLKPASAPPEWGSLILTVIAHAERAVADDQAPVAERTFQATVPMPPERSATLPQFLLARLDRAVEMATTDVLAELWARQLNDAQVLDLMDTRVLWRKVAAAREVGERRLTQARVDLEAAARDPRQDLAAVATAALGRLGRAESVPVLTELIDSDHSAVVDAALASLADIGDEAALAQLRQAAAQHPEAAVRQRAAALLQERAARPTGPRLP